MNSLPKFLVAAFAACFLSLTAFAAVDSPTGTWKWSLQARSGGQSYEQTLKLDYKDGKLTGTLLGIQGGRFQLPDTAISDASFQNGTIKFSVTREFNGNKVTTSYEGKLQGDAITGTSTRPGMNGGEPTKREWNAHRVK